MIIKILEFLGANVLDNKPFIVTPLMVNSNARIYIHQNPDCDRLTILHHVSMGLVYLHSQNVVHGDLKARNVLIDDSGSALLCDFGLASVKADVTSRTTVIDTSDTAVAGSRQWMAPERLTGESLRKPCDIYAFGMTAYEIYANEVPLGYITSPGEHFELVVRQYVRPQRPDVDAAPQLTDEVWQLVERCWTPDSRRRPISDAICDIIGSIIDSRKSSQQVSPECSDKDISQQVSFSCMLDDSFSSSLPTNLGPPVTLSTEESLTHPPSNSSSRDSQLLCQDATLFNQSIGSPVEAPTAACSSNRSSACDTRLPASQDDTPFNLSACVRPSTDDLPPTYSSSPLPAPDARLVSQDAALTQSISHDPTISDRSTSVGSFVKDSSSAQSSAHNLRPASQDATPSNPNTSARPSAYDLTSLSPPLDPHHTNHVITHSPPRISHASSASALWEDERHRSKKIRESNQGRKLADINPVSVQWPMVSRDMPKPSSQEFAVMRLRKELINIARAPCPEFSVRVDENIFLWDAMIMGPADSPYAGGCFFLSITFSVDYPHKPPNICFVTKIFHPNININGTIFVDILREMWSPSLTAEKVLISICSLLTDPHADGNSNAAHLYRTNRTLYEDTAREWTRRHAMVETPIICANAVQWRQKVEQFING